jgi:hypothetical protein
VDPDGRDPILTFNDSTTVVGKTSNVPFSWALAAGDYTINGIESIPGWWWYGPSHGAIETWGTPEMTAWLASLQTDTGDQNAASDDPSGEQPPAGTGPTAPTPPACTLPCAAPPGNGEGPTITTPGVVGWKTGQYELVFNRKGHNAASTMVGVAAVAGAAAIAYEYGAALLKGLKLDGPSKGYAYSEGRLFQLRYNSQVLMRVDLHPRNGPLGPDSPPRWHVHVLPLKPGEHGFVIGRK